MYFASTLTNRLLDLIFIFPPFNFGPALLVWLEHFYNNAIEYADNKCLF